MAAEGMLPGLFVTPALGWQWGTSTNLTPPPRGSSKVVAPGTDRPLAAALLVCCTGVLQGGTTTVRARLAGTDRTRALSGGTAGGVLFFLPPNATIPIANRTISTPPTMKGILFRFISPP